MSIGKTLRTEIVDFGILAMVIVVISVVLLTFKKNNVGDMTCVSPYTYFNESGNVCCTNSTWCNAGNQSAIENTASFVDTIVSGLSEPKNWVIIVIVGLIGFALIAYFRKATKNK
jgi:hypothetical protein